MFLEKLLFDSSVLGLKEHDKPGDKTSSSERNIYVVFNPRGVFVKHNIYILLYILPV